MDLDPTKFNARQHAIYDPLAALGIPLSEAVKQQILSLANQKPGRKPKSPTGEKQQKVRDSNEELTNELILRSLERPGAIRLVECKACKQKFGTNYYSVAYCSPECRAGALESVGIIYDPTKPDSERYEGRRPPATISPELLRKLQSWAQSIIDLPSESSEPVPTTSGQLRSSLPDL